MSRRNRRWMLAGIAVVVTAVTLVAAARWTRALWALANETTEAESDIETRQPATL